MDRRRSQGNGKGPLFLLGKGLLAPPKAPPEAQSQNKARQEQQTGQRPAVAHALTPVSTVTSCRLKVNLV